MLTSNLKSVVDAGVRQRGAAYYRQGAVRIREGDSGHVLATVCGRGKYEVLLEVKTDEVGGFEYLKSVCECLYFEDEGEPCKHIWATLLASERRGFLRGSTAEGPLNVLAWDESLDDEEYVSRSRSSMAILPKKPAVPPPPPPLPTWKDQLAHVLGRPPEPPPKHRSRLHFFIDVSNSRSMRGFSLRTVVEKITAGKASDYYMGQHDPSLMQRLDPDERNLTSYLSRLSYYGSGIPSEFLLGDSTAPFALPWIASLGRLYVQPRLQIRYGRIEPDFSQPITWNDDPAWSFEAAMRKDTGPDFLVEGTLHRGDERRPLAEADLLMHGIVLWKDRRLGRVDAAAAADWVRAFATSPAIRVPATEADEFLGKLYSGAHTPPLLLPPELHLEEVVLAPTPILRVSLKDHPTRRDRAFLASDLVFDYDGTNAGEFSTNDYLIDLAKRRRIRRNIETENRFSARASELGLKIRRTQHDRSGYLPKERLFRDVSAKQLPRLVHLLSAEGWRVEAEGKLYRQAGKIDFAVKSGVDWFELEGKVDFDGNSVPLPRLLAALRKKENLITLDDGSLGILPEEWLKKYGIFAEIGEENNDKLRFSKTQVSMLDALLAEQPDANIDETFRQARDRFRSFAGVQPAEPPPEFKGELRGYQKEGLGWLRFLQDFGFGGCLADDMGLGKTVQVLALLAERAASRPPRTPRPSLAVVPKSLVHNWLNEATRFAPQLAVYAHHGTDRMKDTKGFAKSDLVLTTYGTLRRDAVLFAKSRFDYCILDESQTVKNARTEQAKAVRLITANHRLAMSGTPIENHLGELWSLFEFLNPGMLGSASVFRMTGAGAREPAPETRELLARALRPFILRRTKAQVAKDLPEKTEQTVYCDLEPAQRKVYDELRDYYRETLLGKIAEVGLAKSKFVALEALLRLRQAACHPGLIDRKQIKESSAKLDVLLPQLADLVDEGHKVLVFSQFTSFLAILKKRLDDEKMTYEYLDGKTSDRAERVERFQNDPDCKLFLISLKAGGVGLNLTSADYVFLLDPWWNPAAEAQAIDRAHRIGQDKPVFAYRLIARGTVEEKVLELQKSKRELADAIINADNSLIRTLEKEDLELLLS